MWLVGKQISSSKYSSVATKLQYIAVSLESPWVANLEAFEVRQDEACCPALDLFDFGDELFGVGVPGAAGIFQEANPMYAASFTAGSQADMLRLNRPSILFAFLVTSATCRFQRKSLVTVTPRYCVCVTDSIYGCVLQGVQVVGLVARLPCNVHYFGLGWLESHVPSFSPVSQMFNVSLQDIMIFFVSDLSVAYTVVGGQPDLRIDVIVMSFMKMLKSVGPSTVPWGTPELTGVH